ncbi:MAG: universal stress protein [Bacteroidales bacterium]|nr:universal stress protein [Bacteroidales bacterium]
MEAENKILILTDFTQTCYDSVSYGLEISHFYGLRAVVFHAENSCGYDVLQKEKTEEVVSLYNQKFNMGASLVIKQGTFEDTVMEEIKSTKFLFVILGTHGKSGYQSLTGSFAAKLVIALRIPILVLQNRRFLPVHKVLFPFFKATGISEEYFSDVLPLVRTFKNAELHLVCRPEAKENAEKFISMFLKDVEDVKYSLSVLSGTQPLAKQVAAYCAAENIEMIFNYPPQNDTVQMHTVFEQLMFNIQQIPVMCKYF